MFAHTPSTTAGTMNAQKNTEEGTEFMNEDSKFLSGMEMEEQKKQARVPKPTQVKATSMSMPEGKDITSPEQRKLCNGHAHMNGAPVKALFKHPPQPS